MEQHTYKFVAVCLAVVTCALVGEVARRKQAGYLRVWLMVWAFLGLHFGAAMFPESTMHWLLRSAGDAAIVLAAASLLSLAGALPTRVHSLRWHRIVAGAALAVVGLQVYGWPAGIVRLPVAAFGSVLFLAAARGFLSQARVERAMGPPLLALAALLLGGVEAARAGGAAVLGVSLAANISALFSLLVLAVGMALVVREEEARATEHNLLALSSVNLTTSSYQTGQPLQQMLQQVLERMLQVYGLSRGLITVEGSERHPGAHLVLGFRPEMAARWEAHDFDRVVTKLISRIGGLIMLRNLRLSGVTGRLESDPEFMEFRDLMAKGGAEALLGISLRTKAASYGALVLAHEVGRVFTSAELRLLATLAAQIGLAVENFMVIRDSQRRSEELRLINEIGQAMSSTLEPDALMRLIHKDIQKLVDARNFYIALWDEAHDEIRFELEVANGIYLPKRKRKAAGALTEYVLREKKPLLLTRRVKDFLAEQEIAGSHPDVGSFMAVPLVLYDRVSGVIGVWNTAEGAFDQGHLDLMQTLAAQAAIALENARLFTEEQRRLRQLTFLNHIGRIAISTLNSDDMLVEIAREIQKNFAYDHIGIGLLDRETKEIEIRAEAGMRAQLLGRRIPVNSGVIGRVARTGKMLLAPDLLNESGLQSLLTNARSALCLPIVYADNMLGVLNVESVQPAAFTQEDIMMLGTLADHLATALHNTFIFQRMQQQAITDGLTGMKTRRFFMESMQAEWNRATRSGRPMSLLVFDLDGFKQVNDTMGHLEGDLVLVRLGKILEQRIRASNIVARYGGDEFLVLVPEASIEHAQVLAERLRLWIATDPMFAERKLTASFGIASYPTHGETPEEILRVADAGVYLAKRQGGNCVAIADEFRRKERELKRGQQVFTQLDMLSRRLEESGPGVLDQVMRTIDAHYPATVENAEETERTMIDALAVLGEAVDRLAFGVPGHSELVGRYAVRLARAIGCSDKEQEQVRAAARIHDIGCIGLPTPLLAKRGEMTGDEFTMMKTHVAAGVEVLRAAKIGDAILAAVRHHHEFYNGRGYPDGLRGDAIPLGARILAVADAFDALTSHRPHRRGGTVLRALDEIEHFAGTQFDPFLVKTFVNLMAAEAAEAAGTGN